jgi:ABC-type anion transport system duplicated permease subunit
MALQDLRAPTLGQALRPNVWDVVALILVVGAMVLIAYGGEQTVLPLSALDVTPVTLDPANLPVYALRTTMRMLLAIVCSIIFTFIYAALAAKSRRAEMVLIPLLDILQSVPILGFLTFTVVFFLNLFPGRVFGAELACVFAIFTSQAWNMTFSMYQSIRNVPKDLEEASQSFHLSGWQRFWRLDVPFAMPGLIWNTMMSMSGGWFFVVASEAITVVIAGASAFPTDLREAAGSFHLRGWRWWMKVILPGIFPYYITGAITASGGSWNASIVAEVASWGDVHLIATGLGAYIATATEAGDFPRVVLGIAVMCVLLTLFNRLLWRPLYAFGERRLRLG